jgi:hypothetical protein
MPSVNLRQLRDTKQIKTWLLAGEIIELRERSVVLGRIVPDQPTIRPSDWPDAAARRRRIFGDSTLPGANVILEEREDSRF